MSGVKVSQIESAGFRWRVREIGPPDAAPLLLLHGFTGSGEVWEEAAGRIDGRRCIIPDLPGHGGTDRPEPEEDWSARRASDMLVELMDRMEVGSFAMAGYSMGGRLALQTVVRHTTRVERLVLIGASAGIESPEGRRDRSDADSEIARLLEERGIEAFVDYWEALPIFAGGSQEDETRERMRRIRQANDPIGLAAALRVFGPGAQAPLHQYLPDLMVPTLLVAGGRDSKYRAIAYAMAAEIPGARVTIIADAGHSVPIDAPAELAQVINRFLSSAIEMEGDDYRE